MWAPDRRRHLLEVAGALVAKEGWEDLRMEAVAAAAGVTKPVVYDHFPSRDALLVALAEDYGDLLVARIQAALDRHPEDFRAAWRAVARAYLDCVAERGAALRRLLGSIGGSAAVEAARARVRQRAIALWTARLRSHTALGREEAAALGFALVAGIWAFAGMWIAGTISRRRAEELFDRMSGAVLDEFRRAR
jgi:AcrR family transcriptional regulator